MSGFDLFPAVDIRNGRCVRLLRGRLDSATDYGAPAEMAKRWADEGARWLHVVDLDGAVGGRPANIDTISAVIGAVDIPIQLGGGLRDLESIEAALNAGCERVVLGSAAVEDPDLIRAAASRWPARIVLGLDLRGREVLTRGWTERSGLDFAQVMELFSEVDLAAVVTTDVSRDGALEGPGLDALRWVLAQSPWPAIALGGIAAVEHLESILTLEAGGKRASGAIVGRGLYEETVSLRELLAVIELTGRTG